MDSEEAIPEEAIPRTSSISRLTLIAIVVFPAWVVCVTLCYMCWGSDVTNVCALYSVFCLQLVILCPPGCRVRIAIFVLKRTLTQTMKQPALHLH
jgi:hypothetical protein